MRIVVLWKRWIARAEAGLVRFACWLALIDIVAALSACFAPGLTFLLGIARLIGLAILVPAVLRTLAMAHAEREDAALMQAIAVAVGVVAFYVIVRTVVVVQVCSL